MKPEEVIICRCSDVTLKDLYDLFEEGYDTFEEIKRIKRVGMGPCQANTCGKMVQWEIAKYFERPLEDVPFHNMRPLTLGVKLSAIKEAADDEDQ
ncbi:MAG: (2Fe-2S)-binding protein [Bacillota bacterium]